MQHFRVQSSTFVANSTPPEGGGKPNSLVLAGGWGRGVGVGGGRGVRIGTPPEGGEPLDSARTVHARVLQC